LASVRSRNARLRRANPFLDPRRRRSAPPARIFEVAFDRQTLELVFLLLGLAASAAAVVCGWQGVEQAAWKRKVFKREMLAFRTCLSE
jgi:hypothetical protein